MRTGRNFLYNLLGAGLPLALAAVAVPALGRLAGYERLGFLTIVWAAIGYLGILDLGLSRVFARRIAVSAASGDLPAETAFLRWIAVRLFGLSCVIAAVVAVAVPPSWLAGAQATPEWREEVRQAWWLMSASIPALVLSNLWRGAMEGREAFGAVNALRVLMGAWTFGAPLLLLPFSRTLPALVGGVVLGRWISLVLHREWCRRRLPWSAKLDEKAAHARGDALRHAFGEGAAITVSGVISPLMVVFDRFVLGGVAALGSVAIYAIPQEIVLRLVLVPALLAGVLFPRMAVLARTDSAAGSELIDRATRVTVLLQLPACLALAALAEPLLGLWLGKDVGDRAAPILRWLLAGCILNTAAQVPFAHLQASGRSRLTARFHLAEIVPYVLFLLWAVKSYGALGAAWAWSARCAVDAGLLLAMNWILDRRAVTPRNVAALASASCAALIAALAGEGGQPPAAWMLLALALGGVSAALALRRSELRELLQRVRALRGAAQ
jgi:O-antigen/teichoic acid export membrane protein